ncbi:LUD domain-containing protein [Mucilaginibacter sp. UR6-1]|uniref:LutC/YkgG family protein n=1 Tax=Mucilaginibacter sp. UR6-1 TaxID=1435643 RepID=UPI001E345A26|nr:LUD domain-containing protein [Mucilaginibacter sp. UR6-1]MCC8410218.1 LUD domain-containing protein [Mucilaginibacter sp. UR6-1]
MSREKILNAIRQNQPEYQPLPEEVNFYFEDVDLIEKFKQVLEFIGGRLHAVSNYTEAKAYLESIMPPAGRWITAVPEFQDHATLIEPGDPHLLENVDVAIIKAHFGVAENGAVWVTEELMGARALPFITQHLVILLNKNNIVPLMQQAYRLIGNVEYGYAAFIAGPSKTADIEQSLVIGAHGPRSLTIILTD